MWGVPNTSLSLEEYAEFLQIPEPYFYGVIRHPTYGFLPSPAPEHGTGDYWDQSWRFWVAAAISETEHRLKADRWLGFPIRREYFGTRQAPYAWPLMLGKYVRGMGVEKEVDIQNAVHITLSAGGFIIDPVTITVAVTFTDPDEILVYYPGQRQYTIRPSSVTISSGVATIQIPRCRLLLPAFMTNYSQDNARPDYTIDSYFETTVDVVRNYLDETTGNNLVWWRHPANIHRCCSADVWVCEPSDPCSETKQLACAYVEQERLGIVHLEPATYSSGWKKTTYAIRSRQPDGVELNYMRGYVDRYEEIPYDLKRAVIALTHNSLPETPCFRAGIQYHWYRKDNTPLEPPVNNGWGKSTWGVQEALTVVKDFDAKLAGSYHGGALI